MMRLAVVLCVLVSVAHADSIKHSSGFEFKLPDIGVGWEQEKKGDVIIVNDENDKLPELTILAIPPVKDGTLAELQGRLQAEVARPGVELALGDPVKTLKVTEAKPETLGDARAIVGTCEVNGEKATFAILQRGGKSLILVGVPKDGIFERGASNFREILKGLKAGPKPASDYAKNISRMMPSFILVKDVTATSTFVDKKHKDAYLPANVLWHDVVEDATIGAAPKTAWCEGKPDEGIGETLTITFARPEPIDDIDISAGVWLSDKWFKANNQITALDVAVDGKVTTLKPSGERKEVELKIGKPVSTIAIKIAAVKKGKMNDTCISAVSLHRAGVPTPVDAKELSPEQLAALPASLTAIQGALLSTTPQSVVAFPFTYREAWGPKTTFPNAKALDAACKKKKCPSELYFTDDRADTTLEVQTSGSGDLSLTFPQEGSWYDVWRLEWQAGTWKLVAIDGFKQQQD